MGKLQPDMLDGIGVDLRADQIFNQVQQSRGREEPEHSRAHVDRGIAPYAPKREADIELLRKIPAAIHADPNQPLTDSRPL